MKAEVIERPGVFEVKVEGQKNIVGLVNHRERKDIEALITHLVDANATYVEFLTQANEEVFVTININIFGEDEGYVADVFEKAMNIGNITTNL